MSVDDDGVAWHREKARVGAQLKLLCPGGIEVSRLIVTADDTNIYYSHPASGITQRPWHPDPKRENYGERCACAGCEHRVVGAKVADLRRAVNALREALIVNEDTYFLDYLEEV